MRQKVFDDSRWLLGRDEQVEIAYGFPASAETSTGTDLRYVGCPRKCSNKSSDQIFASDNRNRPERLRRCSIACRRFAAVFSPNPGRAATVPFFAPVSSSAIVLIPNCS